jgi:hypothetical protein
MAYFNSNNSSSSSRIIFIISVISVLLITSIVLFNSVHQNIAIDLATTTTTTTSSNTAPNTIHITIPDDEYYMKDDDENDKVIPILLPDRNLKPSPSPSIHSNNNNNNIQPPNTSPLETTTCTLPTTTNFFDLLQPNSFEIKRHIGIKHFINFILPHNHNNENYTMSPDILSTKTIFNFIHLNKAGGTFIKEDVFYGVAKEKRWNGAGFGSITGWDVLSKGCSNTTYKLTGKTSILDAFACGEPAQLTPCGPSNKLSTNRCPLRLLWGSQAMGLCQFIPNQPCTSVIVLREPIKRMISMYNYACVVGAENMKKWPAAWKLKGYCPLSLLEFVESIYASKTSLVERLTHASDPNPECALNLAYKNLRHPCIRYLLLEKLKDGMIKLAQSWGPTMGKYIDAALRIPARNKTPLEKRTEEQIANGTVMAELHRLLYLDIQLYNKALEDYDKQWHVPLQSCNKF